MNLLRNALILCVALVFNGLLSGQSSADNPAVEKLLKKVIQQFNHNDDSCAFYLWELEAHARTTDNQHALALTYEWKSKLSDTRGQYSRSHAQIDSALALARQLEDSIYIAKLTHFKGRYFHRTLDYDSAFYHYHNAIDVFERHGATYPIWTQYFELGDLYDEIGSKEKAHVYYQKALALTRREQVAADHGFALYVLAIKYRGWDWQAEAANLEEEYLIMKQNSSVDILKDEGHLLVPDNLSNPEEKMRKIREYIPFHEANGNHLSVVRSYFQLGNLELAVGRRARAIAYYQEALEQARHTEDIRMYYRIQETLYRTQKESGDLVGALAAHESMMALQDSIRDSERVRQLQNLEVRYETTQKEHALAIKELELQKSRRTQLWSLLGICALVIIVMSILLVLRTKQKSNTVLAEKNAIISKALGEKDVLLREIHHRVKNNLQMISALLYLQGKSIDDPTAQDAIKESQNRVQSMAMLHQNLYQDDNLLGVEIKDYLGRLFDHLFASYDIDGRVQLSKKIQDVNLDVDTVIPLALIVNELVSNALKYAFVDGRPGEIEVRLHENGQYLVLEVEDNGVGLPPAFNIRNSGNFGYKLINILTEKLGAEWRVDGSNGTKVIMNIEKKQAA